MPRAPRRHDRRGVFSVSRLRREPPRGEDSPPPGTESQGSRERLASDSRPTRPSRTGDQSRVNPGTDAARGSFPHTSETFEGPEGAAEAGLHRIPRGENKASRPTAWPSPRSVQDQDLIGAWETIESNPHRRPGVSAPERGASPEETQGSTHPSRRPGTVPEVPRELRNGRVARGKSNYRIETQAPRARPPPMDCDGSR